MKKTLNNLLITGALALATAIGSLTYNYTQEEELGRSYWQNRQRQEVVKSVAKTPDYSIIQKAIYDTRKSPASKTLVERFSDRFNISSSQAEEAIANYRLFYNSLDRNRANGNVSAEVNGFVEDEEVRKILKGIIDFEKKTGIDSNSNSGKYYQLGIDYIMKRDASKRADRKINGLIVEEPVEDFFQDKLNDTASYSDYGFRMDIVKQISRVLNRKTLSHSLERNIVDSDKDKNGKVTTTELANSCIQDSAKNQFINSVYYRF